MVEHQIMSSKCFNRTFGLQTELKNTEMYFKLQIAKNVKEYYNIDEVDC